jgi:hypothetical protein
VDECKPLAPGWDEDSDAEDLYAHEAAHNAVFERLHRQV